jgi:hypothetical protein
MGVRDALLLNLTGSNFEALQSNDTARIKGDFSIKNTSNTEIFGVDVSTGEVTVAADITSSGDITGSATSTGSFGRVVATTFHGDGFHLRNSLTRSPGLVTGSAQIAADISGAFDAGFFFGFQASSSISGGLGISASFGRLQGNKFYGDGTGMASTLPRSTGILTGSAQIAADISGSFNKGFGFSSDATLSGLTVGLGGTWSAGGALIRGGRIIGGGTGTQNAALSVGGYQSPSGTNPAPARVANTDEYNGSSWTAGNAHTSVRGATSLAAAFGAQNAAVYVGGFAPNITGSMEYNGTNWSAGGDLDNCHYNHDAAGTLTAGLVFGGCGPAPTFAIAKTEAYDGTTWTECNDMNYAKSETAGDGIQTAAISMGSAPSNTNKAETFNGSNWTNITVAPATFRKHEAVGTVNDALFFGGYAGPFGSCMNYTAHWDGTAWSQQSNLINDSINGGSAGSSGGAGLAFGGSAHPGAATTGHTCTEHYDGTTSVTASFGKLDASNLVGDATNLISTLPYSSGLVTSSAQLASDISGSFNKGFTFTTTSSLGHATGSLISSQVGAWSYGGDINTHRHTSGNSCVGAGVASANASMLIGGCNPTTPSPYLVGNTETYNGSTWTEANDLNVPRKAAAGFGTQTAGVFVGGTDSGNAAPNNISTCTEEWDGTSWTAVTAYPQGTAYHAAAGTQNAGLVAFGGQSPAPTPNGNRGGSYSVEYNGTNWVNAIPNVDFGPTHKEQIRFGMAGVQNAAITVGNGDSPPGGQPYAWCTVMNYDGSTWSIGTSTPNGVKWTGLAGTQNDVLSAGGYGIPPSTWAATTDCAQRFNGTAWSAVANMLNNQLGSGANGLTSYEMSFYGGQTEGSPAGWNNTSKTQEYCEGIANLTVDRLKANHITGDGSWLKNFYPNMASSSAQLASDISGSFNKGFGHEGEISGSATSTGSFGRVDSDDFSGDGSELTNIQLATDTVSGSAQIAANISGSFNKGFEFVGTIQPSPGGVWSSGGNLNTRRFCNVTIGNNAEAIVASGFTYPPHQSYIACSETYNGSSWSETNDINTGRHAAAGAGTGTNTALMFGGAGSPGNQTVTEEWNGTNWSEVNDLIQARHSLGGNGTTEAALATGGIGTSPQKLTEEWNGTNWSEVGDLITDSSLASTSGTVNAAIHKRNQYSPLGETTEFFDGSSWSEGADSTIVRRELGHSVAGTTTCAIVFGGMTPSIPITDTEIYNGTSWSTGAGTIGYGRRYGCGAGSSLSSGGAIWAAGQCFPNAANYAEIRVDHWDFYEVSASFGRVEAGVLVGNASAIKTQLAGRNPSVFTGSKHIASDISGSLIGNDPRATLNREALVLDFPGIVSGSVHSTGSFRKLSATHLKGDGTTISASLVASVGIIYENTVSSIAADISGSFTSGFELFSRESGVENQRKSYYVGVSGSAFSHAGNDTTMSISSICGSDFDYRLFDNANQIKGMSYGTGVWSTATAMPAGSRARAMAGTQNAFLSAGSYTTDATKTQKFNGSSWSVSAALNNTGRTAAGVGTQNAMATFGGMNPGTTADDKSELYNGSTWSNGNNMGTTRSSAGSAGTQNAAIIYGGIVNSPSIKRTETELYDGNAFTETADLSTGRGFASAGGTQNDAIIAAGLGTSQNFGVCTEIWNGTSWTEVANLNTNRWNTTGIGTANHMVVVTGHAGSTGCSHVEEWNGDSWSEVSEMSTLRAFAGPAAGGLGSQGIYSGGYTYPTQVDEVGTTELWNATTTTTGSFGLVKPRGGGIDTNAFEITSSLFKLPVFSDRELNYQAIENQYSTGSLTGSVDRVADVIVGQQLGEMWFDSDKNAIGYTYSSRSLISQSLNFGTLTTTSASGNYVTSSDGFFSQSYYSNTIVTCYLTGSQI